MNVPPLDGITVLDFTRVLSGPYLTQLLADLGADVIKIESPQGDDTRAYHPPGLGGEAANYMGLNRGKKSVVADLKNERDLESVTDFAKAADVLVENFRPGTMERLGLGYEQLSAVNPGLVYCSISGYGQTGTYSKLAGYDPIVQAETGFMYLTGDSSQPPTRAGGSLIDVLAGTHGGMGILSALHARASTGRGDHVDISLYNTAMSAASFVYQGVLLTGENPPRLGNTSFFMCPNALFQCSDGLIMISAGNDRLFTRMCEAMQAQGLSDDPRFRSNRSRLDHVEELSQAINLVLVTKPRAYWIDRFRQAGVPAGAVREPVEAVRASETMEAGLINKVEYPGHGPVEVMGPAIRFANAPMRPPERAPFLGEHSQEISSKYKSAGQSATTPSSSNSAK